MEQIKDKIQQRLKDDTYKSFILAKKFILKYKSIKPPFGFNGLGELVYKRTYSRVKVDGVNEKWFETIERVINGTYNMQKRWVIDRGLLWDEQRAQISAQEMYDRMFNMKFLPPGRGLWAMGSVITEERGLNAALNNCAYISTEKIDSEFSKPFLFLMDMSMLGVGVGFDTKGAGKIKIKKPATHTWIFQIPDSREGWVESVELLLDSYLKGTNRVDFDYTLIRKEGETIKGFGGISCGPAPLEEFHVEARKILDSEIGENISLTTIVDIMNLIGKCVVSGNIRRSAELVLGDPSSEEYLDLKNYEVNPDRQSYGWMSNNSVFAELGMNYKECADRTRDNGEPGYFWLENARKYSRMCDPIDNKDHRCQGNNPCITGDCWVTTKEGPQQIKDILGIKKEILLDGKFYFTSDKGFWNTGIKEVYEIETFGGLKIKATSNHKFLTNQGWKEVKGLKIKERLKINNNQDISWEGLGGTKEEGWLLGNLIGDGTFSSEGNAILEYWGENSLDMRRQAKELLIKVFSKNSNNYISEPTVIEKRSKLVFLGSKDLSDLAYKWGVFRGKKYLNFKIEKASSEFSKGIIGGLFDSDGTVVYSNKGISVEIGQSNLTSLQIVQRMLLRLGLPSRIYLTHKEGFKNLPSTSFQKDRKLQSYYYKNNYSLRIGKKLNVEKFFNIIYTLDKKKYAKFKVILEKYTGSNFYQEKYVDKIRSISYIGKEDVYDCTVPEVSAFDCNGFVSHNCAEQSLESYELCCLCETFPSRHESKEDYLKTLKFAYLYAKTITLGETHWLETNRVLLRNRRIGCSVSGITQFIANKGLSILKDWLETGYETIKKYDEVYSEWLCIPKSIKMTSVKPSGSVSLLAGVTPGVHFPISEYYIRRMRLGKISDLIKPLVKAGYKVEPAVGNEETTSVVEIPVHAGNGIRADKDVSMWEKILLAVFMQKYWADNQVSATITFNPETEGNQIEQALNYLQYEMKAVSFLPIRANVYPQMPYESITKERYEELMSKIKPLDIERLSGTHDSDDKFCDGESCQIIK